MTRRVVVHIGPAKTGSTSLQRALFGNRRRLNRHGFDYFAAIANHSWPLAVVYNPEAWDEPPFPPPQWKTKSSNLTGMRTWICFFLTLRRPSSFRKARSDSSSTPSLVKGPSDHNRQRGQAQRPECSQSPESTRIAQFVIFLTLRG